MPKATMSKDGEKRFDLRITHRVGASRLSSILCYKHREDDEGGVEALPDYSRTAILGLARQQLTLNSDAPNWWQDEVDDDWVGELRNWADELIRRKFPELY